MKKKKKQKNKKKEEGFHSSYQGVSLMPQASVSTLDAPQMLPDACAWRK